jgi:predicted DNA-binding antitoxin AbrB/MazE fold protein
LPKVIRARYEGGVLKPLEPLDLRDGEYVIVAIKRSRFLDVTRRLRREAKISVDELIDEVRNRGRTIYD